MAVNIKITEDYRIVSDRPNGSFVVERRKIVDPTKSPAFKEGVTDPEKREVWIESGFHSNIEQCISQILRLKLIESDAESLAQILAEIKAFRAHIDELMRG